MFGLRCVFGESRLWPGRDGDDGDFLGAIRLDGQVWPGAGIPTGVVLGCGGVADGPSDGIAAGAGGLKLGCVRERFADPLARVGDPLPQVPDLSAQPWRVAGGVLDDASDRPLDA